MKAGSDPVRASYNALKRLQGAFALAMIFRGYDDLMIVARQGSPLAIGLGNGEMFVGSDAIALAPFTDAILYLEDGDWAVLTRKGIAIRDRSGKVVKGRIEANDEGAVANRLRTMGMAPLSITEVQSTGLQREISIPGFGARVSMKDLAVMSRQMATMISAGLSLLRTLTILAEQTESKPLAKVLAQTKKP